MSTHEEPEKRSKLVDQIEIEVIRDRKSSVEKSSVEDEGQPAYAAANPLTALEELVERLEELEQAHATNSTDSALNAAESSKSLSQMQRHLEQFQRQSMVLKRLLLKLH